MIPVGGQAWSWDPVTDLQQMWAFPFMVNAFRAGTIVAVAAAVVGWLMVLRRQSFAGHTLAVVGFPGAAGATLVGVSASYGYFAFCVSAAVVIGMIPRDADGHESALTGTIQAFLLACGFLFAALYKGLLGGVTALLFGSCSRWPSPYWLCWPRWGVRCCSHRSIRMSRPGVVFRCGCSGWCSWSSSGRRSPGPVRSQGVCWCSRCW